MKKWLKISLIAITALVIVITASFLVYVSDYRHADHVATTVRANEKNITTDGNLTILSASTPAATGLIFYPGGKVEDIAYLPILEKLRQNDITCVLVKMPFNLAIFDINAADQVFGKLPEIKNWYIGGHSLGGAMASDYASKNQNKVKGLILLGAYIYGAISPANTLTLYGSLDGVLDRSKIDYTENVFIINGGNHAQFGNYGRQNGDKTATISNEQQQNEAITKILEFIKLKNNQL